MKLHIQMVTYDNSSKRLSELKGQIAAVKEQIKVAANSLLNSSPSTITTPSCGSRWRIIVSPSRTWRRCSDRVMRSRVASRRSRAT